MSANSSSKGRKIDPQKSPAGLNGSGFLTAGQSRNFAALGEMIFMIEGWEDSVIVVEGDGSINNVAALTTLAMGQRFYGSLKSITVTSGKVVYYYV